MPTFAIFPVPFFLDAKKLLRKKSSVRKMQCQICYYPTMRIHVAKNKNTIEDFFQIWVWSKIAPTFLSRQNWKTTGFYFVQIWQHFFIIPSSQKGIYTVFQSFIFCLRAKPFMTNDTLSFFSHLGVKEMFSNINPTGDFFGEFEESKFLFIIWL